MFKKADIILIIIITLFAIFFNGFFRFFENKQPQGTFITIAINGTVVKQANLAANDTLIINENNHHNVIEIINGEAKMTEANCPDGTCLHQKAITHHNETIICLPHKLIVKVEGGNNNAVDTLAH